MTGTVTIPTWIFLLLLAFALWAALEWLLLPGARWFFRRKVNRVLQEISVRLKVELPEFKLTRRQVLIDRLFHDARVREAAQKEAHEKQIPLTALLSRVDRYAREIVPSFNAYLYFRVGYWLGKSAAQLLYRVRLGYTDTAALAAVSPKSSIVFIMNHRSNMDYVLVAFLAAERVALSYAVGEWARIWPLQQLIRSMGAYFVRRSSGDPLYRMVLQRYVQMATEAGVPQAVYPEGGLTVDGKLRPPRFGLLDYMLKSFDPQGERDLVFVPVGINYDRVLEDRTLLAKRDAAAPRRGFIYAACRILAFIAGNLWLMITGRWYRFGYACVNFGRPVSMRSWVAERNVDFRGLSEAERHEEVERVGRTVMGAVARIIPVLPVSLVASVFAREPGAGLSELELKSEIYELIRRLEAAGAHIYVPRGDLDYAVGVGLRMLTLRRIVNEEEGLYRGNPADRDVLAYYANAIEPLVSAALGR
ncbi:MAG TPA: 1-acyl-sn-glycerol-3-phosphate acyltransferase [Burkholderiales bacterium]|nr:1-acyl-sn-glycerol-3-phosphate acyltransferase [Burkholderiales bacterium]